MTFASVAGQREIKQPTSQNRPVGPRHTARRKAEGLGCIGHLEYIFSQITHGVRSAALAKLNMSSVSISRLALDMTLEESVTMATVRCFSQDSLLSASWGTMLLAAMRLPQSL
jgi:hypothetical protein